MKKTNLWFSMAAAACAVMINGCTAFGPRNGDDDPVCTGTLDDGVACTVDVCPASGGAYQHIPSDALCASGQMCSATAGCVARDPGCPTSCDDGLACTADSCLAGACRHRANDDACPGAAICRATAADAPSGCFTPPVEECSGGCNDGVACTVDACVSGSCRHVADDTACAAGETCHATRGCVDDTVPSGDFECVFADGGMRIGYTVRLCSGDMTPVRTVPNRAGDTRAMTNPSIRVWTLGQDVPAGGCRDYDLSGITGVINTHPFIGQWRVDATGGHPEWDADILNVADLRGLESRTMHSLGLRAYVCTRATGVCSDAEYAAHPLPPEFWTVGPDTVGMRFWSGDPNLHSSLLGTVARRGLLTLACDASHRPAAD